MLLLGGQGSMLGSGCLALATEVQYASIRIGLCGAEPEHGGLGFPGWVCGQGQAPWGCAIFSI